uniref:Uncharacterized protein n=1 Tax=Candidatus Kentrum sp. FM TaxID=2126340 RepID=A0A450SF62_9GAMM|nr:MAG: hypothetical protein BECKFM1743C_GA0114222_100231 [Candidatus Kentron sp. FM]VFJ51442.1 MAG: hypothetical protein BECKFM1743A_GA0114220_100941 [Candidatus Kentron sp. FM]VFK05875.1 MAG: hypothetical protein BECKFM1743B_GA0114221_100061 [Candidatus Kentron sp. FM]
MFFDRNHLSTHQIAPYVYAPACCDCLDIEDLTKDFKFHCPSAKKGSLPLISGSHAERVETRHILSPTDS